MIDYDKELYRVRIRAWFLARLVLDTVLILLSGLFVVHTLGPLFMIGIWAGVVNLWVSSYLMMRACQNKPTKSLELMGLSLDLVCLLTFFSGTGFWWFT